MHTRKRMMFDLSDAFVVLPGGMGTLDETFEIITWRQLGMHDKPIILLNHDGYWDPFLDLVDHVIDNGFARPAARQLFSVVGSDRPPVRPAGSPAADPRARAIPNASERGISP